MKRKSLIRLNLLAFCLAVPWAAMAQQDYPNRPIKIIVSFSAGGTTDVVARQVGQRLSQRLNQPVIIENRPGAGGTLGTDYIARAPADGYTLLMTSSGPVTISPSLPKKLNTNPLTALVPIVNVVDVPNALVVSPSLGVSSVEDFVRKGKAKAGQMSYGSTGVGTVAHLSALVFSEATGLDATHVPYKGADAVNDLIGGRTDFMFATLPSVIGMIRSGKLRALAVSTDKRSAAISDVPTVNESKVATLRMSTWFGMFAPKGTPEAVLVKLNATINEVLKEKAIIDGFVSLGADPLGGSAQEFSKRIASDYESLKPVVLRSGASAD